MKKQFHKIKVAAESLSRSAKPDTKCDELLTVEKHVEKYKDVLEKIHKKFSPSAGTDQDREKRIKKVHEYRLAQTLEESCKELPEDLILHKVLKQCGELERNIANYILDAEIQTENEVTKKLKLMLDSDLQHISAQKRIVTKSLHDYSFVKKSYENAQKSNENNAKIHQLKQEQEECELKLEKERDIWAAEMFAMISKDEDMASSVKDYVVFQKMFYEKALRNVDIFLEEINSLVKTCDKKRIFGVPLKEHLQAENRKISKVLELAVCCLTEKGLCEEGLLRVGCAGSKLKKMKNGIDAHYIATPLQSEYQDLHVIAGVLKSYLRELPEPLLTYDLYFDFIKAAQLASEKERRCAILNAVNKLPEENYDNLKYLTKFLWLLYQNVDHNKMSSQNIAIVMSPNILWPLEKNTSPIDYVGQVNSSAAVNTIVELFVSDWNYFFDGTVDFFQTLSRDSLFAENDNSNTDKETVGQPLEDNQIPPQTSKHTRSSSHDTNQILLDSITRSQSSGSLSENSSPTQSSSPKLPTRRKHNKPSAPTPPAKLQTMGSVYAVENTDNANTSRQFIEEEKRSNNEYPVATLDAEIGRMQKSDGSSQTISGLSFSPQSKKPEKPPRPAPAEVFTLNRSTYKNRSNERSGSRPVALPRTSLHVTKSTENLSPQVQFRDKVELREKPAIPERPLTLTRPASFRSDPFAESESSILSDQGLVKKTSSFRLANSTSHTNQQSSNNNNNNNTNNGSGLVSNPKTTLERAQFYSVDKKQVAIVNVPGASSSVVPSAKPPDSLSLSVDDIATEYCESTVEDFHAVSKVPPSPKGLDSKIKRPQVPAPPPPNRPKSDGGLGDSTNL